PEQTHEFLRDQAVVVRQRPSNSPQGHPVLCKCQMADLPGDMADAARRLAKPLGGGRLFEKPDGVFAGENDLLDGKLKSIHRFPPVASCHAVFSLFKSSLNRMRLPNGSMTCTHFAS